MMGQARAPKNIGEGLNSVGQALLYRRMMGKADKASAAGADSAQSAMGGIMASLGGGNFPPAPGASPASGASGSGFADAASQVDATGLEGYIRDAATKRGIDPDVAVKAARAEGLAPGVWQSNVTKDGVREPSYGPFQLLVGGEGTGFPEGLGNDFMNVTGLDPSDPKNVNATIDFALDSAAKGGWGPWYGAAKVGIGQRTGLDNARALGYQGPDAASNVIADPEAYNASIMRMSPDLGGPQIDPMRMPPPTAPITNGREGLVKALMAQQQNPASMQAQQPQPMQADPWEGARQPQQMAQVQQPAQMPLDQVPPMAGGTMGTHQPGQGPSMQQLLQASQNPWLSDPQRGIVNMLMQQQMQKNDPANQLGMEYKRAQLEQLRNPKSKPTSGIQEYEYAVAQGFPGSYTDFQTALKKAGATSVSVNGGSSKYNDELDKKFAEQYISMQDGAQSAQGKMATLQGLKTALEQSQFTGMGAETVLSMKQAGRMLGLDIGADLGPEETARALGNQLALQMRSPSSGAGMPGAMSDKDREFLVASVPGLTKTPQGNQRLVDYMMSIEQRNIDVANMAQEYADRNGQIDNGFYKELSKWSAENPLFETSQDSSNPTSMPSGVSEEDIQHTMKIHGLSREQVLERLNAN